MLGGMGKKKKILAHSSASLSLILYVPQAGLGLLLLNFLILSVIVLFILLVYSKSDGIKEKGKENGNIL